MAPLERTHSVRVVIATPVVDISAPGLNTARRIAYRPPIHVSPGVLALSVSYCNGTLWSWGQLWQDVRMDSLGTCLHWDCNAMGDIGKISHRVPSTCAQNAIFSLLIIHIIPSHQIYVAIENPSFILSVSCLTTSSYLWNYVCAANDVFHAENLQSNSCRCFSHLYKFRDRIQVTRVFRYCGECQG